MSKIRIVEIQPGFAPEVIRAQWVGMVVRLATEKELKDNPPSQIGIGNENTDGYFVLGSDAIAALKAAGKYEAAYFWEDYITGKYLRFLKKACELIE